MVTLRMDSMVKGFTILSLVLGLGAHGFEPSQVQIKKFRFHSHHALNFERLVIEFGNRGGNGAAKVRMAPTGNGKETVVGVERVALVGAIPEAAINDAYSRESHFFGPIAINNDNPNAGFTIRTFVKNPNAMVDAFWLENPSRLILDVYPKTSPRAQGPEVLAAFSPSRGVASHGGRRVASHRGNVVCYFSNSQVVANLGFEKGNQPRGLAMVVDDSNASPAEGSVVCYPTSAQAQPRVTFNMRNQTQKVSMDFDQRPVSSLPFSQPQHPQQYQQQHSTPLFQSKPTSRDEQLNRDADMALGGEDDGRGLASPGLFSGMDNFNKNNPPPTLGKQLAPPSQGGGLPGRSPQLANPAPAGLLPPLR